MQPQIVNEYESGKAIPNNAIIAKFEKALGCKGSRAPLLRPRPLKDGRNSHTQLVHGPARAIAHTRALQSAGSHSTIGPLDAHFEFYSAKGRT